MLDTNSLNPKDVMQGGEKLEACGLSLQGRIHRNWGQTDTVFKSLPVTVVMHYSHQKYYQLSFLFLQKRENNYLYHFA